MDANSYQNVSWAMRGSLGLVVRGAPQYIKKGTGMIERIDYVKRNEPAIKAMAAAKRHMGTVDIKLRALVELRVSQMNGCVYCVDTHTKEARAAGERQQRLDCLPVWRDCTFFDAAERAALDWAEAVTRVAETGAPEPIYQALRAHYSEQQIVDLTLIIAQMNAWNRLAISFGHLPDRDP